MVLDVHPTPPKIFIKIRPRLLELSCGQSDRETDKAKTLTAANLGGGRLLKMIINPVRATARARHSVVRWLYNGHQSSGRQTNRATANWATHFGQLHGRQK